MAAQRPLLRGKHPVIYNLTDTLIKSWSYPHTVQIFKHLLTFLLKMSKTLEAFYLLESYRCLVSASWIKGKLLNFCSAVGLLFFLRVNLLLLS